MTTKSVVTDEQLGMLGRRCHDLFRRVCEGTLPIGQVLDGLQCLIEGRQLGGHVVGLDIAPFVPDGWKIESHKKGGLFKFDPSKILLHQEPEQKNGGTIRGTELQKRLASKICLNACMLDYLLAHTDAIPESWKTDENGNTRYIYFFDTVYRGSSGSLCVRCLCWCEGQWSWDCGYLGSDWDERHWVAIPAS